MKGHKRKSFAKQLEKRVEHVLENHDDSANPISPGSMLRSEMRLTLERLKRERSWHKIQLEDLLQSEAYADTELMRIEDKAPRYAIQHSPEKDKWQQRLLDLGAERRRVKQGYYDRIERLHAALLDLVNKHTLLEY